jgi:hypothetical protein
LQEQSKERSTIEVLFQSMLEKFPANQYCTSVMVASKGIDLQVP